MVMSQCLVQRKMMKMPYDNDNKNFYSERDESMEVIEQTLAAGSKSSGSSAGKMPHYASTSPYAYQQRPNEPSQPPSGVSVGTIVLGIIVSTVGLISIISGICITQIATITFSFNPGLFFGILCGGVGVLLLAVSFIMALMSWSKRRKPENQN